MANHATVTQALRTAALATLAAALAVLTTCGAVTHAASAYSSHALSPESLAATQSTQSTQSAPAAAPAVAEAAPRDYISEVRANFTPESRAYAARRAALGLIDPLYGIAVGLLLLFSGLAARMRDAAHNLGDRRYVRVLVFFALYTLVGYVLTFPLAWYGGFALEHQFGLSNQSFGAWLGDEFKGQVAEIFFFGVLPVLALAYAAIEKSPRRWWAWLSVGSIPVIVIAILIEPVVFDPLFNKFTPLRDQHLKSEILDLAARAGIPAHDVYQVDKSRQTRKYNAYVSGFGASQRIVLWDTALEGMKEDEILYMMGHEMGHYKLGHISQGILAAAALSFAVFFVSAWIMRRAVAQWGGRWGFTELHDVASLPLFAITLTVFSLIASPLANTFSRRMEHEADIFGLEVTHLNDAAARTFIKFGTQNRSNPEPGPLLEAFEYTHPPLIQRVRFAMKYRPWERGEPNRFFKPGR